MSTEANVGIGVAAVTAAVAAALIYRKKKLAEEEAALLALNNVNSAASEAEKARIRAAIAAQQAAMEKMQNDMAQADSEREDEEKQQEAANLAALDEQRRLAEKLLYSDVVSNTGNSAALNALNEVQKENALYDTMEVGQSFLESTIVSGKYADKATPLMVITGPNVVIPQPLGNLPLIEEITDALPAYYVVGPYMVDGNGNFPTANAAMTYHFNRGWAVGRVPYPNDPNKKLLKLVGRRPLTSAEVVAYNQQVAEMDAVHAQQQALEDEQQQAVADYQARQVRIAAAVELAERQCQDIMYAANQAMDVAQEAAYQAQNNLPLHYSILQSANDAYQLADERCQDIMYAARNSPCRTVFKTM